MKTLYRWIDAFLVRIGWNEASENHVSPAHGWLLPAPKPLPERLGPPAPPTRP